MNRISIFFCLFFRSLKISTTLTSMNPPAKLWPSKFRPTKTSSTLTTTMRVSSHPSNRNKSAPAWTSPSRHPPHHPTPCWIIRITDERRRIMSIASSKGIEKKFVLSFALKFVQLQFFFISLRPRDSTSFEVSSFYQFGFCKENVWVFSLSERKVRVDDN